MLFVALLLRGCEVVVEGLNSAWPLSDGLRIRKFHVLRDLFDATQCPLQACLYS